MYFKKLNIWLLTILGSYIPLLWLIIDIVFDNLGANPIQAIHIRLGDWTLRFLCITLAVTPLQTMTNWRGLTNYRQWFGLCTFFYASLHLLAYLLMDQYLQWRMIAVDIMQSVYLWFGIFAYIVIFLLAITTPKFAKKMLAKNWKHLHRVIYAGSIAAILHYFWQLKGNLAQPVFYLILILFLLSFRVLAWLKDRAWKRLTIPGGRKGMSNR